ncbi:MAG TPA: L,D-transpeptidase family protein [Acidimicrobiia bacterium]|nr:L,D-transpeptidase family protein [Acidimicrobiia bacterium]
MRNIFRPRVLIAVGSALGLLAAVAVAGALLRSQPRSSASSAPERTSHDAAAATTTSTLPATTTTTTPALVQPPPATLPPLPSGGLGQGSSGPVVAAYQQRLTDVHFDPGPVDGHYGQDMAYAVDALQKLFGLPVNGRIGLAEAIALTNFRYPEPLVPNGEPNRTEIDVSKQVLTLYAGGQVRLITTMSSGSGEHYCYTDKYRPVRVCENAYTPSGRYTYTRFVSGWDTSPLGHLYNPFYFNGGIAVHGYPSVPNSPASHGCVRIPMDIANYFHTLVNKGDPVYVLGGSDGPGNVTYTPIPTAPPTTAPPATPPPPAPPAALPAPPPPSAAPKGAPPTATPTPKP